MPARILGDYRERRSSVVSELLEVLHTKEEFKGVDTDILETAVDRVVGSLLLEVGLDPGIGLEEFTAKDLTRSLALKSLLFH